MVFLAAYRACRENEGEVAWFPIGEIGQYFFDWTAKQRAEIANSLRNWIDEAAEKGRQPLVAFEGGEIPAMRGGQTQREPTPNSKAKARRHTSVVNGVSSVLDGCAIKPARIGLVANVKIEFQTLLEVVEDLSAIVSGIQKGVPDGMADGMYGPSDCPDVSPHATNVRVSAAEFAAAWLDAAAQKAPSVARLLGRSSDANGRFRSQAGAESQSTPSDPISEIVISYPNADSVGMASVANPNEPQSAGGMERSRIESRPGLPLIEGPNEVPAQVSSPFHGRERDLARLSDAVTSAEGPPCIIVTGMPGVGKSTLVNQFVATIGGTFFSEGIAWLDATRLPAELQRIAHRFGCQDSGRPDSPETHARWLAWTLRTQRVLLVLDSVPEDVNVNYIPAIVRPSCIVLTSRFSKLEYDLGRPSAVIEVKCWDAKTARSYLQLSARPPHGSSLAISALVRVVGGLPIALRLLWWQLQRPMVDALSLLARLKQAPLETLDSVVAGGGGNRGIQAVLQMAFNDLAGVPFGRQVLIACAVCARSTTTSMVAIAAGVSNRDAEDAMIALSERFLVEYHFGCASPWKLHDLVRAFAMRQPEAASVVERHLEYVLARYCSGERRPASDPGTVELNEVLAAANNALERKTADVSCILLRNAWPYFFRCGLEAELFEPLLNCWSSCSAVFRWRAEEMVDLYGFAWGWPRALSHYFGTSYEHYCSEGDRLGQCRALVWRADSLCREEHLGYGKVWFIGEAVECYVDALVLARSGSSERHQALMAGAWAGLGDALLRDRSFSFACDFLRGAATQYSALGDLQHQAFQESRIGDCYVGLFDYRLAFLSYRAAFSLYSICGCLVGQIAECSKLGDIALRTGHPRESWMILIVGMVLAEERKGRSLLEVARDQRHSAQGDLYSAIEQWRFELSLFPDDDRYPGGVATIFQAVDVEFDEEEPIRDDFRAGALQVPLDVRQSTPRELAVAHDKVPTQTNANASGAGSESPHEVNSACVSARLLLELADQIAAERKGREDAMEFDENAIGAGTFYDFLCEWIATQEAHGKLSPTQSSLLALLRSELNKT